MSAWYTKSYKVDSESIIKLVDSIGKDIARIPAYEQ